MSFAYILETHLQPVQPIYSILVPTATGAVAGAGLTAVGTSTVWVGTGHGRPLVQYMDTRFYDTLLYYFALFFESDR